MQDNQEFKSIFLRYRNGSKKIISNDLKDKIKEFIGFVEKSNEPAQKILCNIIEHSRETLVYRISTESTWFRLIEEVYEVFDSDKRVGVFNFQLILQLLKILVSKDGIADIWSESKEFILKHIDELSMWNLSYYKIFSEESKIIRDNDGRYFIISEGEARECIGAKTAEETKFDYIMSTTLSEYGVIYQLLKFISLVFISIDYKNNNQLYPKSLNVILPESDNNYGFLHWKWELKRPYGYNKSGWRPQLNFCDPEWLVSDILACYSDNVLETYSAPVLEFPEESILAEYENTFKDFEFQLAYALDTQIIISDKVEKYFKFRDRNIRWINGNAHLNPIIVIPVNDIYNIKEEENIANEFISELVWQTQYPIRVLFGAATGSSFIPPVSASKESAGILLSDYDTDVEKVKRGERELLALALYKEGVNSSSVYYSALNYYKIIELSFGGKKQAIKQWIDENEEYLIKKGHRERIEKILSIGENIGEYIYVSCRCAVAHAGQINATVSPDDNEDLKRIYQASSLIRELAKKIIKDGLLINN